jgi:hydrogenase-4 component B
MTLTRFIVTISILFLVGFLIPFFKRNKWLNLLSLAFGLAGSLLATVITAGVWTGLHPFPDDVVLWQSSWLIDTFVLPEQEISMPALQWLVGMDALSGFFGFIIAGFSALVAIYSFRALQAPHYQKLQRHIAAAFNLFVWSTLMVVFTVDLFFLVVVLEIMTLAFGYLALYKHMLYQQEPDNPHITESQRKNARLAPQVYMIVSHTSTVLLLVPILILAINAQNLSFRAVTAHASDLTPTVATVVFLLSLAGLGVRAGLTPAHFWVPLVHPASPTTTHALSLGAAIKVSIYLMFRFFFQFLQPVPWWGYLVLAVAVITALVNVWYALASHDLKTALAYHSIENIGIIMVGMGMAMIFVASKPEGWEILAGIAIVASLYHTLNHAVFKGLLYLATGAIDNLTGQIVSFNKLGGLINKYRVTAAVFMVGAVAIAGFPPLNGFVSEWLTIQSLLNGTTSLSANNFNIVLVLGSLIMLAATFALTAICFYKIAGLTLLGQPRASETERARWSPKDIPFSMGAVMVFLAVMCLVLGVLPNKVIGLLSPITSVLGFNGQGIPSNWTDLPFQGVENFRPLEIEIMLIVVLVLGSLALLLNGFKRRRRVKTPWNCGTPFASQNMLPSGSFLSFLTRNFLNVTPRALSNVLPDYLPARLTLSRSTSLPQYVVEWFRAFYNRLLRWLLTGSTWAGNTLQNGDIRRYLGYIFLVNIIVLVLFLLIGE